MSNTAVITEGSVEGSVSNCAPVKELTNINKKRLTSLTQESTYSVMNSCTGEIINEYTMRELTVVPAIIVILLIVVGAISLLIKIVDIITFG